MTDFYGALGLNDAQRGTSLNLLDPVKVYDVANNLLAQYNAEMERVMGAFIEGTTETPAEFYFTSSGGTLQRRGGQARSGARKTTGGWDVAYPLEDFGEQVAEDDVTLAYMSAQDLQLQLDSVITRDWNTVRQEIMVALYNNANWNFRDTTIRNSPTLVIRRLANNDGTLYPPEIGAQSESQANHYLVSGYTSANISDTNNPVKTIRARLDLRFGLEQGYGDTVVLAHTDDVDNLMDLTDWVDVTDNRVQAGDQTPVPTSIPSNIPGVVRGRASGAWVAEWPWQPAGYLFGYKNDAPKPVKMRVDPADKGLGRGLQLVARKSDHPFEAAFYRHRFGLGVGNRLNGVIMQLKASGSYEVPAQFAL